MRRTFQRAEALRPLLGLREPGETVDVTSFGLDATVRFTVEGAPPVDDFFLRRPAWEQIGCPDRISVSVEAA